MSILILSLRESTSLLDSAQTRPLQRELGGIGRIHL